MFSEFMHQLEISNLLDSAIQPGQQNSVFMRINKAQKLLLSKQCQNLLPTEGSSEYRFKIQLSH